MWDKERIRNGLDRLLGVRRALACLTLDTTQIADELLNLVVITTLTTFSLRC
jgi:hypothetical protein